MDCSAPGSSVLHYFLEFVKIHVCWISDAITITISSSAAPSPFAFNLSQHQGLFQWISSSHQMTQVLELQPGISLSNEYLELISFRIDWFDFLALQGTLSLVQHHSLKTSVLPCSAFFMVQLSHLYLTTGKTVVRLKLKKVEKTTRTFRYDLNQTPYDYIVEVMNRLKGLNLVDRVPEDCGQKFILVNRKALIS